MPSKRKLAMDDSEAPSNTNDPSEFLIDNVYESQAEYVLTGGKSQKTFVRSFDEIRGLPRTLSLISENPMTAQQFSEKDPFVSIEPTKGDAQYFSTVLNALSLFKTELGLKCISNYMRPRKLQIEDKMSIEDSFILCRKTIELTAKLSNKARFLAIVLLFICGGRTVALEYLDAIAKFEGEDDECIKTVRSFINNHMVIKAEGQHREEMIMKVRRPPWAPVMIPFGYVFPGLDLLLWAYFSPESNLTLDAIKYRPSFAQLWLDEEMTALATQGFDKFWTDNHKPDPMHNEHLAFTTPMKDQYLSALLSCNYALLDLRSREIIVEHPYNRKSIQAWLDQMRSFRCRAAMPELDPTESTTPPFSPPR